MKQEDIARIAYDPKTTEQDTDKDGNPLQTGIRAAFLALRKNPDMKILAVGKKSELEQDIETVIKGKPRFNRDAHKIILVHADNYIGMHENPRSALENKNSSIYKCFELVKNKEADVVVSPGNSGATNLLAGTNLGRLKINSSMSIKDRLLGRNLFGRVSKPGLLARIPTQSEELAYLIDAGASIDQEDYHLGHYALMLHAYLKESEGIDNPRIALLNIGSENWKGNSLYRCTYEILSQYDKAGLINFVGNLEPEDVYKQNADGFVCDSQVGNIFIKASEAVSSFQQDIIKESYKAQNGLLIPIKFAGGPALSIIKSDLRKKVDLLKLGGGLILGVKKPVIVVHGNSGERELAGALLYASKVAKFDLAERIDSIFQEGIEASWKDLSRWHEMYKRIRRK